MSERGFSLKGAGSRCSTPHMARSPAPKFISHLIGCRTFQEFKNEELQKSFNVKTPYFDADLALTQQMGEVAGVYPVFSSAMSAPLFEIAAAATV